MQTLARLGLCFVVLPLVPLCVLFLMPDEQPTVWLDPIAVFVYCAIGVGLISGAAAYLWRTGILAAAAYAVATGLLSIVPLAVAIAIAFEIHCGDGDTSGAC